MKALKHPKKPPFAKRALKLTRKRRAAKPARSSATPKVTQQRGVSQKRARAVRIDRAESTLTLTQERGVAKKQAFLAAFRNLASVKRAAKAARIDRSMHYDWLAEDPDYRVAFEAAREEAAQVLEDEAVRRAYNGTLKPVFFQGERVDAVIEYSDALLMFLLKGWRPERYRERADIEHSGPGGGPIDLRVSKLAEVLSIDELKSVRARLAGVAG